jgi:hypothetical protein
MDGQHCLGMRQLPALIQHLLDVNSLPAAIAIARPPLRFSSIAWLSAAVNHNPGNLRRLRFVCSTSCF